ncbi:acetoacetate decarboxylase family protein [Rhodoblastus acidophilus]|uniref:Acetoacetate decarboxylase family protein n=1 Tax=Candidatus Rhodoblastus alkanivorans TaxID=2954117 RepID=A0ABS9Z3Q4_9HYPH|nr:acetoacetate decarboxylase family protein [Candidatus Rhodoblastus alkanivorans]MCI4680894.1 acetoacetate decarboxylase family protein [Candidatus Rhodoblastus alkanivorans]MCI4682304.1 acetoacetate decarboxylase family protein [Candidatus Rhodoblastus alkanivorans]MDI4639606.1 acetoacetate decarboxylase family protein [Rhodoblastus acidophilus]
MSGKDIFADVKQMPFATSAGPVGLPVLYRDGSMLLIGYRIDPAVAKSVLGNLPLEPLVVLGRVIVLLILFEYRDTTIGPYNEICLGVMARRPGTSPSLWSLLSDLRKVEDAALYVTNLPVTTNAALTGGIEIWGYPKYLTGITTSFRPDGIRVTLENEFVLTHSPGFGLEVPSIPFVSFTVLNKRLLRTVVEVDSRVRFGGANTVRLTITGDGPTAKTIKALSLDTIRPSFTFRTDALHSVLPSGKDIGAVAI